VGEPEQHGRTIVFGMPWEPISLYPLRTLDSASYYAQGLVYEGLVKYDHVLRIVPAAAESFQISPDGKTYTFKLRKNVGFSDGKPVTIVDVIESIRLAADPSSPYHADYEDINRIERKGEDIIVLHLDQPCAPLLSRIVEIRILPLSIIQSPDHGRKALSRNAIGTGPFRLTGWNSGAELRFQPNPYYWGNKPQFDKLVWRIVLDRALMDLALQSGELDAAQVDAAVVQDVRKDSRLQIEQFPASRTVYMGFNLKKAPFDNKLVRQALCLAMDRKELVDKLYQQYARIAHTDFPPTGWTYKAHEIFWTHNTELARAKLRQAGYQWNGKDWRKNGELLAFPILTVRDYQDVAQVIADDLGAIGIPTEVHVVEFSTLRMRYLKTGKFDTVVWSRSVGPDPECLLSWHTKGPLNFSSFSDPRMDEDLEKGRRATDKMQRLAVYQDIQDILATDLPWVFLLHPKLIIAHDPNIENIIMPGQQVTGLPWDNPMFNAPYWKIAPVEGEVMPSLAPVEGDAMRRR
jgi:peptide/nickel transport system substrate-binding protein